MTGRAGGLFALDPKARRPSTSTALVHLPLEDGCPTCSGELHVDRQEQGALFLHGGYGGTTYTVWLHCPCGWSLDHEAGTIRPWWRGTDRWA